MTSKNWCFTLNNYNSEDVFRIEALTQNKLVVYIVIDDDVTNLGVPFLQGLISFNERMSFSQVKQALGKRVHILSDNDVNNSILYYKRKFGLI